MGLFGKSKVEKLDEEVQDYVTIIVMITSKMNTIDKVIQEALKMIENFPRLDSRINASLSTQQSYELQKMKELLESAPTKNYNKTRKGIRY